MVTAGKHMGNKKKLVLLSCNGVYGVLEPPWQYLIGVYGEAEGGEGKVGKFPLVSISGGR